MLQQKLWMMAQQLKGQKYNMATFEVTLKNGHTYEIEAPEDSTDEFLRDKAQKFDVEDNPEYDYTTQAVK